MEEKSASFRQGKIPQIVYTMLMIFYQRLITLTKTEAAQYQDKTAMEFFKVVKVIIGRSNAKIIII